jgi:hypothetical protein
MVKMKDASQMIMVQGNIKNALRYYFGDFSNKQLTIRIAAVMEAENFYRQLDMLN